MESCEVAIVGSGFTGSLLARILTVLGYEVALLERGTHPRFAIGESTTPLANLSLERIATRYGLEDCWALAAHGRWMARYPELQRGLKRGFTFYRHQPGEPLAGEGEAERLLVAASPSEYSSDTHWLRAAVDHHFVHEAERAGVAYRDRVSLTSATRDGEYWILGGRRDDSAFTLRAGFLIDASGPGGFLANALSIPSGLSRTETRSSLLFSHFDDVRLLSEVAPSLPAGPYPDDWAAVHHLIDEGWMYSLRFDHGTTSAGFLLTPGGLAALAPRSAFVPEHLWRLLLDRYPTIGAAFADARPLMPIAFRPNIQHRLTRAAGNRWAMMPHAYAFVDPLFSTGIAWGLRAVERLALMFEDAKQGGRAPEEGSLARYDALLAREADQIDRLVAGAYEAMSQFELLAAQAMIYFATVSFAEVKQRLMVDDSVAWDGFLGVGDPVLEPLPGEALRRLRQASTGFVDWVTESIAPRNIAGLADPARRNLYPVDLDVLVERHSLLGLTRDELQAGLPALRGSASSSFGVRMAAETTDTTLKPLTGSF
jgi:tetracycline 7-halogenase / FADH2 O2-dependent halogenase